MQERSSRGSRCAWTCPYGQVASALAAAALLLVPGAARASNPWLTPLGSEAAMSGGAVSAMGRDTGAAFYNPAGLGANTRAQFDMSSTLVLLRHRVIPGAFRIDLPGSKQEAQLSSTQPLLIATSLFYARYLGRGVTVGGGKFTNNYDYYDYRGQLSNLEGADGIAYDARVQVDGWGTRHYIGPTVGWQIRPRIRIGLSLFGTYEWQRDEGRIWAKAGPSADQLDNNYITGDLDTKRSTYGFEAVIGVQWEFIRNLHLGFTIHTPRLVIRETVRRAQLITRGFEREDGTDATEIFTDESNPAGTRRGQTAPVELKLGLGYALPRDRGWVSIEADYSPRLRHVRNDVDLRNNVNARIGARIRVSEKIIIGLGFFTDRNNQSTENLKAQFPLFLLDYYGFSTGFEFRRNVRLGSGERARDIQFLTAIALRYAYGTGRSGAVRFDLRRGLDAPVTFDYSIVHPVGFHVWGGHLGAGFLF